jgi:hypothetical protein
MLGSYYYLILYAVTSQIYEIILVQNMLTTWHNVLRLSNLNKNFGK